MGVLGRAFADVSHGTCPCCSPGMLGVCLWLGYTQGCWHIPYLCSKMLFVPICASLEHQQCCCHLPWHRGLVAQSLAAS